MGVKLDGKRELHLLADFEAGAHEPASRVDEAPQAESAQVPRMANRAWAPIRALGERHRERIKSHLFALDGHDRYLRFGYCATDGQISKYVVSLDFERDEIFGVFNRRLELIALAHLAHDIAQQVNSLLTVSEFGASVLLRVRGRGFGRRLFERAMLHARNRGVNTLLIHALSENTAMLKIARGAGAIVERNGPETQAWVELPPDTVGSHVEQLLEGHAAEVDYHLKVRARQVTLLLEAMRGVNTHVKREPHDRP